MPRQWNSKKELILNPINDALGRLACNRRLHDFIFGRNFFLRSEKKGEARLRKENDEKENEIFMFHFAIRIYFPVSLIQPRDVIKLSVGALGIISEHDVGELGFEAHPAQLDKKREVMAEIN